MKESTFQVEHMDEEKDMSPQDEERDTSPQDEERDTGPLDEEHPSYQIARIDELEQQLSEAQSLSEERLDQLMRCRADLDNLMKRSLREKENTVRYASEKLVHKLLPVLDSLEQAAKHDGGMNVLYMQLSGILSAEGLAPIEAVGKKFDPYRHEALFQVKRSDMEEDVVAEEIQKGYLFNSHVIRFSKVAVNKPAGREGCD
ncbi:MAG: nucleotide exchange factor GrpE [Methanothrix sp.]|jgi:molecular chaperone GrpE|uniref:nucleotide exchange factor GrpE n=2 Tax=Methanothrix sp. TaxID=90426 RepID=UPI001BD695D5